MKQLESQPFQSKLNLNSEEFENNKSSMLEMISELNELLDEAEAGGGPDHHKRLAARGKLPVRERVFHFLDPDSPFLEISGLAAAKPLISKKGLSGSKKWKTLSRTGSFPLAANLL